MITDQMQLENKCDFRQVLKILNHEICVGIYTGRNKLPAGVFLKSSMERNKSNVGLPHPGAKRWSTYRRILHVVCIIIS